MSLFKPAARITLRAPSAAVPDNHGAAAVLTLGDVSFEFEVFFGMVLGTDREPLLADGQARSASDRPAFENAIKLESQVIVQPACRVFLDDELPALGAGRAFGPGFRASGKITLAAVLLERRLAVTR